MAINYTDIVNNQAELHYVAPQYFYMVINNLPKVTFNCQQVQVPTLSGGEVNLSNSINPTRTFLPGDGVDYSNIDLTFLIDQEFQTYRSILEWLKAINYADNTDQYGQWINDDSIRSDKGFSRTMSDITLFGSDASNEPVCQWVFKNAFPISLDGPQYDATLPDIEYLTSTVSFRYTHFIHSTYTNGIINDDGL